MCANVVNDTFVRLCILVAIFAAAGDCDLYEGSRCRLENGATGICRKLADCPSKYQLLQDRIQTEFATERCGFDGFIEIVCCPTNDRTGPRQADIACQQYANLQVDDTLDKDGPHFIYGGNVAARLEFPFMAALGYQNTETEAGAPPIVYRCGGSLISLYHILTAAHCVTNIDEIVPVEVLLGTIRIGLNISGMQRARISKIMVHPLYKRSSNYHDVAILELETRARIRGAIRPVCLYTIPPNAPVKASHRWPGFVVTGWGATDFDNESSDYLIKTPFLRQVRNEDCNRYYTGFYKLSRGIDNTLICTIDTNQTRRADACQGDSGGPLLTNVNYKTYVVGITAFGQACGTHVPGVYTAVLPYLSWIEEIVWSNTSIGNIW